MPNLVNNASVLDRLFSQGLQTLKSRVSDSFIERINKTENIILYGAGTLGKLVLAGLQKMNKKPLAFVEDFPSKQKRSINGVPVLSIKEAVQLYGNNPLYIVTILNAKFSYAESVKKLTSTGLTKVLSYMHLFGAYPSIFLPHYCIDRPETFFSAKEEIFTAYDLFSDEQSKTEFVQHMLFRLNLDFSLLPPQSAETYFRTDLSPPLSSDVGLVDLGAFSGDTLKSFLQHTKNKFGKVWALEPDPKNYAKLCSFVETLEEKEKKKIECLNLAISDGIGELGFIADGTEGSHHSPDSVHKVRCATIDSLFLNENVDFIKFDIEGMEKKALHGGQTLIATKKPILAVSAYHCPEDLWQIPIYLKSLNNDYKVFLRTEGQDGMGTVCYAC